MSDKNILVLWSGFLMFLLLGAGFLITLRLAHAEEDIAWEQLQKGTAVALVRHAIAPGNGDPVNFSVDDCSTQRNLSEEGHQQSQQIGELFKSNGIQKANVFSSQWCRCLDTAIGFNLGYVQHFPVLNSFYQDRSTESEQTDSLQKWIVSRLENVDSGPHVPAILVSHQVNITSLTGVFPSSGEIVIVGLDAGRPVVLGTFETR